MPPRRCLEVDTQGADAVAQIIYLATPLPDTQWTALPAAVRWQVAGVILAAVLLASAAGLLLARRISRPLGKLAVAAQAVAAGDLGQTVPRTRRSPSWPCWARLSIP